MNVVPLTEARERTRIRPTTLREDFLVSLRALQRKQTTVTFPSPRWQKDPVGFAREVLGIERLAPAQIEILESVRDHRNTSIASGHKCGKSLAIAIAALWFWCSYPEARVLCTAVKAAQVEKVIWREIRKLHRQARIPLGGTLNDTARSGLTASDGREIIGTTAQSAEGLAGFSSANMLVLADEASGIADQFFEVLGTSLAGSGGTVRKCYISNPTRTEGEFFRSQTVNAKTFNVLSFSSEDTPNARGEEPIPGLAGPEWIAERAIEWGVDSPTYQIRVRGKFVRDLDGKIISLNALASAVLAWDDAPDEGQLQLGVDPAGDGIIGDETAMALRRGDRIVTIRAWRTMSEDEIATTAIEALRDARRPRDRRPRLAIDVEGGIGSRVAARLMVWLETHPDDFDLIRVRGGQKMWGSPEFHLVRDGLWGQCAKWIKAGGAIPDDVKLQADLNAPMFTADPNQRYRATDKKDLRKILGRSPDRGDATCLAIWGFEGNEALDEIEEVAAAPVAERRRSDEPEDVEALDHYAGARLWQGRR